MPNNYDYGSFDSLRDALQTLTERRDYLVTRIAGKKSLGWETQYDEREHESLCLVLKCFTLPELGDGA